MRRNSVLEELSSRLRRTIVSSMLEVSNGRVKNINEQMDKKRRKVENVARQISHFIWINF